MRIRADLLRVRSLPYDDRGQPVEPEQQLAQRVYQTDSPAGLQGGPVQGTIPTEVIYETTAGHIAGAMRNPCFSCARFDRKAWRKLLARWNDPTAPRQMREYLNQFRAALLQTQNATIHDKHESQEGDLDVEHALATLGVCHAFSELRNDVAVVYPTSACPDDVCTPTQPNGFYVAKDRQAERMGSQVFDRVMAMAQGKPL